MISVSRIPPCALEVLSSLLTDVWVAKIPISIVPLVGSGDIPSLPSRAAFSKNFDAGTRFRGRELQKCTAEHTKVFVDPKRTSLGTWILAADAHLLAMLEVGFRSLARRPS